MSLPSALSSPLPGSPSRPTLLPFTGGGALSKRKDQGKGKRSGRGAGRGNGISRRRSDKLLKRQEVAANAAIKLQAIFRGRRLRESPALKQYRAEATAIVIGDDGEPHSRHQPTPAGGYKGLYQTHGGGALATRKDDDARDRTGGGGGGGGGEGGGGGGGSGSGGGGVGDAVGDDEAERPETLQGPRDKTESKSASSSSTVVTTTSKSKKKRMSIFGSSKKKTKSMETKGEVASSEAAAAETSGMGAGAAGRTLPPLEGTGAPKPSLRPGHTAGEPWKVEAGGSTGTEQEGKQGGDGGNGGGGGGGGDRPRLPGRMNNHLISAPRNVQLLRR